MTKSVRAVTSDGISLRSAKPIALAASPPTALRQASMVEEVRIMQSATAARRVKSKPCAGTVRHSQSELGHSPQPASALAAVVGLPSLDDFPVLPSVCITQACPVRAEGRVGGPSGRRSVGLI
jgi:hypothetical protein